MMNPVDYRGINQPSLEFVHAWAEELAEKFSCTIEDMQENGLSARHFSAQTLELRFVDGSLARFEYAFFVVSKDEEYIAVFTEHCGYFSWSSRGITITKVSQ